MSRNLKIQHQYGAEWPDEIIKRTARPSRFKVSLLEAIAALQKECRQNKLSEVVIQSNIKYNTYTGQITHSKQTFHKPAIVEYTTKDGIRKALAYDKYDKTACNIYAIANYMEEQRRIRNYDMHLLNYNKKKRSSAHTHNKVATEV